MKKEALWYYEFDTCSSEGGELFYGHDWQVMTSKQFNEFCKIRLGYYGTEIYHVKRRKASLAEKAMTRLWTEYKKRLENSLHYGKN